MEMQCSWTTHWVCADIVISSNPMQVTSSLLFTVMENMLEIIICHCTIRQRLMSSCYRSISTGLAHCLDHEKLSTTYSWPLLNFASTPSWDKYVYTSQKTFAFCGIFAFDLHVTDLLLYSYTVLTFKNSYAILHLHISIKITEQCT